jgi:hypothetical protein
MSGTSLILKDTSILTAGVVVLESEKGVVIWGRFGSWGRFEAIFKR